MTRQILIISNPDDIHAYAVSEALYAKEVPHLLLDTTLFPSKATYSIHCSSSEPEIHLYEKLTETSTKLSPNTIWWRRPKLAELPDWLHENDIAFAALECDKFLSNLWQALDSTDSFWVNPYWPSIYADQKFNQQHLARKVGLKTPETLYSNNPEEIRKFILKHDNRTIYKPFSPKHASWVKNDKPYALYTSAISLKDLPSEAILQITPGIFQPLIEKAYELRVTFIGNHCISAKLHSQETQKGTVDWRAAYDELKVSITTIPQVLKNACALLMKELNIVFGCFDFIVTPAGEYIFLEVNESGQFLWIERYTKAPILDIFTNFLMASNIDFAPIGISPKVSYSMIREKAAARMKAAAQHRKD